MIVKCEAQQIMVLRVDRKLAISALKVYFVNATTLAFSQNEFAQTVDARCSEFEWRILVGVQWNATIDRKCWWKTQVQDHLTFGRITFWNRLKWRTN